MFFWEQTTGKRGTVYAKNMDARQDSKNGGLDGCAVGCIVFL